MGKKGCEQMLSKKMLDALNAQINAELYSSYLYLAMAAQFEADNLKGFGRWMQVQAQEEHAHAMKMYSYVNSRGGRVTLTQIAAPPAKWASPLAAFEAVLKHEQKVTKAIGKLVEVARADVDNATEVFLQWFVTEQVEEEASAGDVVEKLRMIKGAPQGLLMLDGMLGGRTAE